MLSLAKVGHIGNERNNTDMLCVGCFGNHHGAVSLNLL